MGHKEETQRGGGEMYWLGGGAEMHMGGAEKDARGRRLNDAAMQHRLLPV